MAAQSECDIISDILVLQIKTDLLLCTSLPVVVEMTFEAIVSELSVILHCKVTN
jgi:hypothetical protein